MKQKSLQKIDTTDITKPIIGEHVLTATPIAEINLEDDPKQIIMYHVKSRIYEHDKLTHRWEEYFEAHVIDKVTNKIRYIKIK